MAGPVCLLVVSLFLLSKTLAMNLNITKKNINYDGKLIYHMAPVISPDITVHVVWYGAWKPAHKRIIREFINSFSAPIRRSPLVSDWWKVAWVGNSERICSGLCAYPFTVPDHACETVKPLKSPNGEVGVDAMISVIANDMEEMAMDPLVNDWYASSEPADPVEIADISIGKYRGGCGSGYVGEVRRDANGAVFIVYGIRRRFHIQWVWSYVADDCVGP
ncbi:putative protein EXORDIUM [Helianthus annuus]|nr:putative protein EXORDIUM [Helianthus annuus]